MSESSQRAAEYRDNAKACVCEAQFTSPGPHRDMLLTLEQNWLKLAEKTEEWARRWKIKVG